MSDNFPKGLPEVDPSALHTQNALEKARVCECGRPARIVSNRDGTQAYCGPCKKTWPISSAPLAPELPMATPRGLSKQTLVEPDWDRAFDPDVGDVTNEQVGPKRR